MTARLMILNGPNLNLLGVREPHIYGSTTLATIKKSCEEFATFASAQLSFHQTNHEGELVDLIQSAREQADALIVNPAAYSFTSLQCSMHSRSSKGRSSKSTFQTFTPATSCIATPNCHPPSRR